MTAQQMGTMQGQVTQTVAMVSGEALLERLDKITDKVARVETLVTLIPGEVSALRIALEAVVARVSRLEQWRAFWTGVTAVITLLLTAGVVAAFVTGHRR